MQCQSFENKLPFKGKKGMTRIGRRLVEDFLLPALNAEKYGELLQWIDKDNGIFKIRWSHKNAAKWTHEDTVVFQDWDRLKGHYLPERKGYFMQAKQRFRAALYKLNSVVSLQSEDKHVKKYQLIMDPERRKNTITRCTVKKEVIEEGGAKNEKYQAYFESERKKIQFLMNNKDENPNRDSCIMFPGYIGRHHVPLFYGGPSAPEDEKIPVPDEKEFARCIHDYKDGYKQQSEMMRHKYNSLNSSPKKDIPLREVNDDSIARQNGSHVPIKPVPVYQNPTRIISPHLLLVKTYNNLTDIEVSSDEEEMRRNNASSDHVLNLSVKSDESR